MRSDRSYRSALTGGIALILLLASSCRGQGDSAAFVVDTLVDRVHVLRPVTADYQRTNSLVIELEQGVLVVEAQPSPAAARDLLAAVRKLTDEPVRYLVLTHPHAESAGGVDAFPAETLVIGATGWDKAIRGDLVDFFGELRDRGLAPDDVDPLSLRQPDLAISRSMFPDEQVPVHVLTHNHAHAVAGLVVLLPEQDILFAGSLVFPDRNPWSGDAVIDLWLPHLNNIIREIGGTVIPLHGEPMESRKVMKQRDGFAWLRAQVGEAFVNQIPREEIATHILARKDEIGRYFDVDAEPSFVPDLVQKVVDEAIEERRKRGMF